MPATFTSNLNLALPEVDVDSGWGTTLNSDFVKIDDIFTANGTGTSVGLNVGSGKTMTMGGTLILGRGDNTNTVTAPTIRGAARTGTNATGANLTIRAANGTGSGGSGDIIFQTAPAQGSGSSANSFDTALVIDSSTNVGIGGSPTLPSGYSGLNVIANGVTGSAVRVQSSTGTGLDILQTGTTGYVLLRDSGNLIFSTGASERMRIASTGALGFDGANYGTAGQVLTSGGSGTEPSWENVTSWTSMTAQTSSGNTQFDFTSIPSGVTVVQVVFHNLQLSGTEDILVRLGAGTTPLTTGYTSVSTLSNSTTSGATAKSAEGFLIRRFASNSDIYGILTLSLRGSTSWDASYTVVDYNNGITVSGGGGLNLGGTLDRIRIVDTGSNTFTNGGVNVLYQR